MFVLCYFFPPSFFRFIQEFDFPIYLRKVYHAFPAKYPHWHLFLKPINYCRRTMLKIIHNYLFPVRIYHPVFMHARIQVLFDNISIIISGAPYITRFFNFSRLHSTRISGCTIVLSSLISIIQPIVLN